MRTNKRRNKKVRRIKIKSLTTQQRGKKVQFAILSLPFWTTRRSKSYLNIWICILMDKSIRSGRMQRRVSQRWGRMASTLWDRNYPPRWSHSTGRRWKLSSSRPSTPPCCGSSPNGQSTWRKYSKSQNSMSRRGSIPLSPSTTSLLILLMEMREEKNSWYPSFRGSTRRWSRSSSWSDSPTISSWQRS